MKAMVLAAGKGTRLLPLTKEIPKPMVPIVGKPMIQHIFELLAASGVDETRVNVFHLAESVLACYGERSRVGDMSVRVSREERLMGTAGGVKRLASISRGLDEAFVVVMGDALTDIDVREVVAFHKERKALATLALMPVSDTSQYGVVRLDGEGNILAFQEKPDPKQAISTLANTGIYVLEPEALDYVPEDTFFDFANDLFPCLLEAGERFVGYRSDDFYWSDVGTLEAYRAAQADALAGKVRVKIPGERLAESIWIDTNARLHQTVTLEGPVVLGRDTVVERGVTLSRNVTVGSGCRVLCGAIVKGSVLLPGSTVGSGAYLEGCTVGPGYEVPPRKHTRSEALFCNAC